MKKIHRRIVIYAASLLALIAWYMVFRILLINYPEFSGIPYAMSKALLGIITLRAVDDFVYPEVDTKGLFNRNSQAYAVYMLAYALIIGLSIMGA